MYSREWLLTIYFRNGQIKCFLFNSLNSCLEHVYNTDYTYIKEFKVTNSIYWVN